MQLTLTLPILVLLAAIVLLWRADLLAAGPRTIARLRADRIRRRLEREIGGVVVPVIGQMIGDMPDRVLAHVERARRERTAMWVLIDSPGGLCHIGMRLVRAISSHKGGVFAVVPRRAWSNGAMVALGADLILLGRDAHLGPCCPIGHIDPTDLHTAAVGVAAEEKVPVEQVRARWMAVEQARAIEAARTSRGEDILAARDLAKVMTSGTLGTHWRPLFAEDLLALGVRLGGDPDPTWAKLARLYLAALEPHDR